MFEIIHLQGNTHYIKAPTNMGLYKIDNNQCILIDTCYAGSLTDKLLETLEYHKLQIKAILHTHGHVDHYGADAAIKEKYHCSISASSLEHLFIEDSRLQGLLVFNSAPLSSMKEHYPAGSKVDFIFEGNTHTINDTCFQLFPLKGHSLNHTGIVTPDNVLFTGDAFLGKEDLDAIKMFYNYDTQEALRSLKSLLATSFSCYVPSHGDPLSYIGETVQYNIRYIENNGNMLYQLLAKKPLSLDEIMKILVSHYSITEQLLPYYIAQACVSSLLSYLESNNRVKAYVNHGMVKFSAE